MLGCNVCFPAAVMLFENQLGHLLPPIKLDQSPQERAYLHLLGTIYCFSV